MGMGGIKNTKPKIKPARPMRPLFWVKIPNAKLAGTVWLDYDDMGIDIHEDELVELFGKEDRKTKAKKSAAAGESKAAGPKKAVSRLSGKRQQNAGIALSQIKSSPDVVEDWLMRCSTKLTAEIIRTLLKLVPTKEEIAALGDHDRKQPKTIPPIDAFMLMLGDIPRIQQRLEALLLSSEFESKYEDAIAGVNDVLAATRKLKSSAPIRQIVETVLALGNYINGSTRRGQCMAFKLDALAKLENTRGNDNKTTLMMFLVRLLNKEQLGGAAEVADAVDEAAKVTFSQVDADCNALRKQTKMLAAEVKKAENAPPSSSNVEDGFVAAVKPFAQLAEKKMAQLDEQKKTMADAFNSLVKGFGEDPSKNGPEVFFKTWSSFFVNIEHACASNAQLAKAKKQAQQKARRASKVPGKNAQAAMMGQLAGALKGRQGPGGAALMGQLGAALGKRGKKG
jgi:hypothetical protein